MKKKSIRYKMRKCFNNDIIKTINKQFEEDDWFNGRFYLKLEKEFYKTYSSCHKQESQMAWVISFNDRLNILNTYLFITDWVYYWSYDDWKKEHAELLDEDEYKPITTSFIYNHINTALNSWLQFCEYGEVFDSPSHCDMTWIIDSEHRSNILKNTSFKLPKDLYNDMQNCIDNFSTINSFTYTGQDLNSCTYKISNNNKYIYTVSGLLWSFRYGAVLCDENNELLCMFIKSNHKLYAVLFKHNDMYKPWRKDEPSVHGYEVNLDNFDPDKTFRCWLALNGIDE